MTAVSSQQLAAISKRRTNPIFRRVFIGLPLTVLLLTVAQAQQPNKLPRIAYLSVRTASSQAPRLDAFRQGLRELGYIERKNILVEYRFADGEAARLPDLVNGAVRQKVDVIVSGGSGPTRLAKEATNTIPIVMAQDIDPIGNGLVVSLAHPGGNITGLSTLQSDLTGKPVGSAERNRSPTHASGGYREIELGGQQKRVKRRSSRGGGVRRKDPILEPKRP